MKPIFDNENTTSVVTSKSFLKKGISKIYSILYTTHSDGYYTIYPFVSLVYTKRSQYENNVHFLF
jgi:hypothetical protein